MCFDKTGGGRRCCGHVDMWTTLCRSMNQETGHWVVPSQDRLWCPGCLQYPLVSPAAGIQTINGSFSASIINPFSDDQSFSREMLGSKLCKIECALLWTNSQFNDARSALYFLCSALCCLDHNAKVRSGRNLKFSSDLEGINPQFCLLLGSCDVWKYSRDKINYSSLLPASPATPAARLCQSANSNP